MATIFYSKFVNVVTQIPTAQQIIPASFEDEAAGDDSGAIFDYEPSEEAILADLLPKGLRPRSSRLCSKTGRLNRVHGCPRWTTRHATRVR